MLPLTVLNEYFPTLILTVLIFNSIHQNVNIWVQNFVYSMSEYNYKDYAIDFNPLSNKELPD